jgi:hypothetical protein
MFYPIIDFQSNDIKGFIKQWRSFYNYENMNLYDDNIGKVVLSKQDLIELYIWKNGTILSEKKMKSLETKILNRLDKVNEFKQNFSIPDFLDEFEDVSFVWKIFLLHIVNPIWYPIYDQHVHRAYLFLTKDSSFKAIENTISKRRKDNFYFGEYLHFTTGLKVEDKIEIQDIDRALFSFGQFLKNYKVDFEK